MKVNQKFLSRLKLWPSKSCNERQPRRMLLGEGQWDEAEVSSWRVVGRGSLCMDVFPCGSRGCSREAGGLCIAIKRDWLHACVLNLSFVLQMTWGHLSVWKSSQESQLLLSNLPAWRPGWGERGAVSVACDLSNLLAGVGAIMAQNLWVPGWPQGVRWQAMEGKSCSPAQLILDRQPARGNLLPPLYKVFRKRVKHWLWQAIASPHHGAFGCQAWRG